MSTDPADEQLADATDDLLSALRDLEQSVDPPGPRRLVRPPTPRGLLQFTSEVAIPGVILVLRTNIAALELLQRTLRMANDQAPERATPIRDRAVAVTATSLSRLDDALADLQGAMSGRARSDTSEDLLEEVRQRATDLEAEIERLQTEAPDLDDGTPVDVEGELESLRQSVDGDADDATGRSG